MPMKNDDLIKVKFDVIDYYGPGQHATERLWAKHAGNNHYVLESIPAYAYGYSYEDEVLAKEKDGELIVSQVVRTGGHSTIRIMQPDGVNKVNFDQSSKELKQMGCKFESNEKMSLVAIDVPPNTDYKKVIEILEQGKEEGYWHLEEANVARV